MNAMLLAIIQNRYLYIHSFFNSTYMDPFIIQILFYCLLSLNLPVHSL